MATKREKIKSKAIIISKAIEILKLNPNDVRYSDLVRKIHEEFPETPLNTIRGTVWNLETRVRNEVYKPARGLFRHVTFKRRRD